MSHRRAPAVQLARSLWPGDWAPDPRTEALGLSQRAEILYFSSGSKISCLICELLRSRSSIWREVPPYHLRQDSVSGDRVF